MNPALYSAARILEIPARDLSSIVVPIASGNRDSNGGRGIPDELARERLLAAIAATANALDRALEALE